MNGHGWPDDRDARGNGRVDDVAKTSSRTQLVAVTLTGDTEETMTIADWVMILAVLLGPVIAVRLTRYLDNQKEERERKLQVFKTLMATRAYTVSWEHVVALNRIDLEFDTKKVKEKVVIDAWKAYLDLLGDKSLPPEQWAVKRVDLLVELLHAMAKVLDYDFDKTHIKNSSYSPIAHGQIEDELKALRVGLIEVLAGKRELPIAITKLPPSSTAPTTPPETV